MYEAENLEEPQKKEDIENFANSIEDLSSEKVAISLEKDIQVMEKDSDEVIFVNHIAVKRSWVAGGDNLHERSKRSRTNEEPDEKQEVAEVGEKVTEWNIEGTDTLDEAPDEGNFVDQIHVKSGREGCAEILDDPPERDETPESLVDNGVGQKNTDGYIEETNASDEDRDEVNFVDQIDVKSGQEAGAEILDDPPERAEENETPESLIVNGVGDKNNNGYIEETNTLDEDPDEGNFVDEIFVRSGREAGAEIPDDPPERAEKNETLMESLVVNGVGEKNIDGCIEGTNTLDDRDEVNFVDQIDEISGREITDDPPERAEKNETPENLIVKTRPENEMETFENLLDLALRDFDGDSDEVIFVEPTENEVGKQNTKRQPLITYPKTRKLPSAEKIEQDFSLLAALQMALKLPFYQNYHLWDRPNKLFSEILLHYGSPEYEMISNMFRARVYGNEILRIFKIENPFLLLHYHIAKSKFLTQNDRLEERFYFHGTWESNLTKICRFNFDRSMIKAHKFGMGISFAYNSKYATDYPRSCHSLNRMMVVAKTFYKNPVETGFEHTIIPEGPSYTTKNKGGSVLVKYDDASYYPAYVINYYAHGNYQYYQ